MIGVSLPFLWLCGHDAFDLDRDKLLQNLKEKNVASIELRTVRATHAPEDVAAVADMLFEKGFSISVHGEVKSVESAVADVFAPLQKLLQTMRQKSLNITVHPIDGNNVQMLHRLADHIEANGYLVTVALENNRLLPNKSEGDSAALVLEAVSTADRAPIGICFDFGHYIYYRLKNHPDEPLILPPPAFFQRVIHTHIHALNGLKTHFPLQSCYMPLQDIFAHLSFEYFGLYQLELDLARIQGKYDPAQALLGSVEALRAALPACALLYDEVREDFDGWMHSALTALDGNVGTKMGLIHSTSYLFNTNGLCWGMDIAFRNARFLANTPAQCAALLQPLALMIVTHEHRDHFEESTVRALADTALEWVIPDFLYERARSLGLNADRIHIAHEGEALTIKGLTVLPFAGRHFRPGTTKGVREYGYLVTAPHAPSLVFPADVRDFSTDGMPNIPQADYCFAHVWLGDRMATAADHTPQDDRFAAYMLQFSSKHILLTHLLEDGRRDEDRWQLHHAAHLAAKIKALSPQTQVLIPHRGEVLKLD